MRNTSENVLDVIKKIADPKFQREVWVEGKYWDRVTDFEEAVNTLEDYNFFTDVSKNRIGLSGKERRIVNTFAKKLSKYDSEHGSFTLTNPRWREIVDGAVEVYNLLLERSW